MRPIYDIVWYEGMALVFVGRVVYVVFAPQVKAALRRP